MPQSRSVQKLMRKFKSSIPTEISPFLKSRQEFETLPYRQKNIHPGDDFVFIGNSFNTEPCLNTQEALAKRKLCLDQLFGTISNAKDVGKSMRLPSLKLEEAMANANFLDILSRFEKQWLNKLPKDTLIGPAYDHYGEFIDVSFSVWRHENAAPLLSA
jgi:hypothetical protein